MAVRGLRLADADLFGELVELHGFSVRGLAREVGCDHAHLVRVQAGRRNASPALAGAICAVLKVRPSQLWVPAEEAGAA